ncbi:MAG: hypothetical protein Q4D38_14905, partial [Planctomycetia bacterium]|nr:hypothetical protein [Planctomycetia bacterium]
MEKRAFLYGVSEYETLVKLNCARQDAEAVAEELMNSYGFGEKEVVLKTCSCPMDAKPLTKDSILGSLKW